MSTPLLHSPPRRPAPAVTPSSVTPADGDDAAHRTSSARPVVLVVEDTSDVRELYAAALGEAGYEVLTASDGLAALELCARHQPRLIVMDLAMPNMDGWEATRRIRAASRRHGHRPTILAVSAFSGPHARNEAFDSGADGFIDKPCTPDMLVSVVGVFLGPPPGPPSNAPDH